MRAGDEVSAHTATSRERVWTDRHMYDGQIDRELDGRRDGLMNRKTNEFIWWDERALPPSGPRPQKKQDEYKKEEQKEEQEEEQGEEQEEEQ
jgi:hypothetical protein